MSWNQEREALIGQANANLKEAADLLAAEKRASETPDVERVKQAMLANIHRNLKYVDFCEALLGAT